MIKVNFFKRGGFFYGFRESGHAGFADEGHDILCSAVSAMTMLVVNTVEVAWGLDIDYAIDETSTDVTVKAMCALPEYAPDDKAQFAVSGLMQSYFLQLMDLTEEYYDYLEVGEIEE